MTVLSIRHSLIVLSHAAVAATEMAATAAERGMAATAAAAEAAERSAVAGV